MLNLDGAIFFFLLLFFYPKESGSIISETEDLPYSSGEILQLQLALTVGIEISAFLFFKPNYSRVLPLLVHAQGNLPLSTA